MFAKLPSYFILMGIYMTVSIKDSGFNKYVKDHKGYVLVDFWAEWCGPCKQLGPTIDEISKERDGEILKIYKLNIDENPETPTKFGVRSIPTLILFKDGEQIDVKVGNQSKRVLLDWIDLKVNA